MATRRRASVNDIVDLTRRYVVQEVVDPLRGMGRFIGMGLGGALCLAVGILTLLFALLRFLQTQTGDVFDGNWSFVPYLITVLVTVVIIVITASRIQKHGLSSRGSRR